MPRLSVRVRNMSSLQAKVKRADSRIQKSVIKALKSLAVPIKKDIQQELRRPKSGPIHTRYRPKRRVKVSLPGEPPARDLGVLVNSIKVKVDPSSFNLEMGANAPYARDLEYGTRRVLPRPFLRPALTRWRKVIVERIRTTIKESL